MDDINNFLQKLSISSNIDFCVNFENGENIFTSRCFVESSDIIHIPLFLGETNFLLRIDKKFKPFSKLLKFTIENKYVDLLSTKEQYIVSILDGKDVSNDTTFEDMQFLSEGYGLIYINLDGSLHEALNITKQAYSNENVFSILYKGNILVMGVFENIADHAIGIRESIISNLFCKCYVSFSRIVNAKSEFVNIFNECEISMLLGKKFKIKTDIFDYNKLFLERLIYSLNSKCKQHMLFTFKEKLDALDNEMINTIEDFFNSDLNISDSAKNLYIHRNTLLYRLDKIKRETGFDIKDFNEAMTFKIIFLIWLEIK
ncbi:helix-turn-helix domain-containing protein [Clostridium algoriphilum]|uniref:PucR family transcriptional regulator n=1 Tax=Clostridium algoriphilum TaxID=198347 RepID=UPI001CF5C82C|nr:helix-turn-helix domain-containing protein [Clostridium algoriphilum]MCB2295041.1 helix-turn-helix domain-containing protein [Clostridium algoriphilum]